MLQPGLPFEALCTSYGKGSKPTRSFRFVGNKPLQSLHSSTDLYTLYDNCHFQQEIERRVENLINNGTTPEDTRYGYSIRASGTCFA